MELVLVGAVETGENTLVCPVPIERNSIFQYVDDMCRMLGGSVGIEIWLGMTERTVWIMCG